jgi:hypothetical protein
MLIQLLLGPMLLMSKNFEHRISPKEGFALVGLHVLLGLNNVMLTAGCNATAAYAIASVMAMTMGRHWNCSHGQRVEPNEQNS